MVRTQSRLVSYGNPPHASVGHAKCMLDSISSSFATVEGQFEAPLFWSEEWEEFWGEYLSFAASTLTEWVAQEERRREPCCKIRLPSS